MLYSTCFGWQSHPSSWVHLLYMAKGKQAHLVSRYVHSTNKSTSLSIFGIWTRCQWRINQRRCHSFYACKGPKLADLCKTW